MLTIELTTSTYEGDWDSTLETHSVICDGKTYLSQSEGIEPEDVLFCRDLCDPHDIEELLVKVWNAGKKGESICIDHKEIEE